MFGAGLVGVGAVMGAKLKGAERIVIVETSKERAEFAKQLGATDFIEAGDGAVELVETLLDAADD